MNKMINKKERTIGSEISNIKLRNFEKIPVFL